MDVSDDEGDPVYQVAAPTSNGGAEHLFESLVGVLLGDSSWARPALGALFGTDVDGPAEETLTATAKTLGVTVADLRAVGRLAALRARSPHAHWAHLVPAVDSTPPAVSFHDA